MRSPSPIGTRWDNTDPRKVGRFDEAVTWQRDALEFARKNGPTDIVARLTENLRRYEARQPCRTPWTDDDPVHHPRPAAN